MLDSDEAEVLDPTEVLDQLVSREPVMNRLRPEQLDLLFRKLGLAQYERKETGERYWSGPNGLSTTDVAGMLEVAGMYGLDPFAPGEIWVSRGKPKDGAQQGKLMLMVGRDGLRKIAIRNGLELDGDVVRAGDRFVVTRGEDRQRSIFHEYAEGDRGDIVGAWAEVFERKTGRQRGFFFAPLSEYKPASPGYGSPWAAQVSAMIRKAAERQAISQATPLGGLMVEGEMDVNLENERRGPVLGTEPRAQIAPASIDLDPRVAEVVIRAQELGHGWLGDEAGIQMQTKDQPEDFITAWVTSATFELDKMEAAAEALREDVAKGADDEPEVTPEPEDDGEQGPLS